MNVKDLIKLVGFFPKERAAGVYRKVYAKGYVLEVDIENERINYGKGIKSDSKTTQNFSQPENFVVLECVNRLLEKGYKPQNITLEKTWAAGHGTSGRLDICVTRDGGSEYLLIECKTYGKEFEKEFTRMKKDGGQLFTYFKFSNKADVIMLYTSELNGREIVYHNEIVKIEDDHRTGDVNDFYNKWNKLTKDNGIFETWVKPYNFESKALIKEQLKEIGSEDSSFIFNRFLEILRHNVVSDKGNAFNKIFTLFLCKVYDETSTLDGEELKFQWKEGIDNHIEFQLRLTDLYSKGMQKFLGRTVSDFNEKDFNKRCKNLNDETKDFLLREVNKLRLEKNNEFAIKEVYDKKSFEENAKVVKEVVELIQGYRIRYNKRQQYLSDFFEQLLTTGLKQEAGQFFTPVPIAQFIIKSLPLDTMVSGKLKQKDGEILPYMIDYAAGSGHFITEYMHEVQKFINQSDSKKFIDSTAKKIKNWQDDHFDWATQYVYGVEKDYRLVKVGKVGCYLHGDGLANVILSDGLANFNKCKDYKLKLKKDTDDTSKDNQQFDILLSNPPYSVSAFKQTTRDYYTEHDFELYSSLTDNSSEIECLFVERMKQLLKDGGVAGVIFPSSILSNEGIYTKAREIILQNFEIIAITELSSNTFMATGTNTVVLFLRRRNNYDNINLKESIKSFFVNFQDVTLNGIEKPVSQYVNHVWKGISFNDYITLLKREPNSAVVNHEIYREYSKKNKARLEKDFLNTLIETEKEKLLYFILAYPQRVVLIKTGEKDAEKRFLGYEFSNRRGSEGIHPIQRGKTITECTRLFDEDVFNNPEKASTYIYKAFADDYDFPVHESLKDNISRVRLVDMITFDRESFTKSISMAIKKKLKIESKWDLVKLGDIISLEYGKALPESKRLSGIYPVVGSNGICGYHNMYLVEGPVIIIGRKGSAGKVTYITYNCYPIDTTFYVQLKEKTYLKFLYYILLKLDLENKRGGIGVPGINRNDIYEIKIPLPPLAIQHKIVSEIEAFEKEESEAKEKIEKRKKQITDTLENIKGKEVKLGDICMYSETRIDCKELNNKNYVGVDNLLQNMSGKTVSNFVPENGTAAEYKRGDVLLSNIRPYLKKIWYADNNGGSSNDVLVLQIKSEKINSKYVYLHLKRSKFFDYEMLATKGVKMPRGDKQHILDYKIPLPPLPEQEKIIAEIEEIETQITKAQKNIEGISALKNEVLKKYL